MAGSEARRRSARMWRSNASVSPSITSEASEEGEGEHPQHEEGEQ